MPANYGITDHWDTGKVDYGPIAAPALKAPPKIVMPSDANTAPAVSTATTGSVTPGDPAAAKPTPQIVMPGAPRTPAVSAGVITPQAQETQGETANRMRDEAERDRLKATGSGVSQLQKAHPFLGSLARVADIAGSILAPGISMAIPGTTMHHQLLVNQNTRNINTDVEEQEKQAQAQKMLQGTSDRPEDVQHIYADAVQDAMNRGVDATKDPKVMQLADTITQLQKQPAQGGPDIQHLYAAAVQDAIGRGIDPRQDAKVQQIADVITQIQKQGNTETGTAEDQRYEKIVATPKNQRNPADEAWRLAYEKCKTLGPAMTTAASGVTTMEGVKRINNTELQNTAGAGRLLDQIRGKVGKLTEGQPLDPALQKDLVNLADILQKAPTTSTKRTTKAS
jgi:hypothetical protein